MIFPADQALKKALEERIQQQKLRQLSLPKEGMIDFCSNDYLGFATSETIRARSMHAYQQMQGRMGATGSRLISGNSQQMETLEAQIAHFHSGEAALLFNSGYDANIGLLACIASRHDTILYDEQVHASIRDGLRLCMARTHAFRHNDITALAQKLEKAKGHVFVVVESIYSMDGDAAPLKELVDLAAQKDFQLIVDEAHALGVFGTAGRGLLHALQLENAAFARIYTFGKALGAHGAAIVGSKLLQDYLINFCRSFIYTTAPTSYSLCHLKAAYDHLLDTPAIDQVTARIQYFRDQIPTDLEDYFLPSQSAIQSFMLPDNTAIRALADFLLTKNIQVKPIFHPTVSLGKERLRIGIHSTHQPSDIDALLDAIEEWMDNYDLSTMSSYANDDRN